jgi:nucleotide-binding universal stress UspA family protein
MKSILLYANDDHGFEARLQASLDVVGTFDGHLSCVHATPYNSFIIGDPFGGMYALPVVVEQLTRLEAEQKARVEARLDSQGVSWEWLQVDGAPEWAVNEYSRLADLVVLSLPAKKGEEAGLAADVALHSRGPVLAVPDGLQSFDARGAAAVAWNGSPEAARSLRLALPMLAVSRAIHVLTVDEQEISFPAEQAIAYLARHGLRSERHDFSLGKPSIGATLLDAAGSVGASYLVMGAYGHSRLREAVLGGVTRHLVDNSGIPLLLAH